jgi:drug/metabolite transporter (DMT)-like permease
MHHDPSKTFLVMGIIFVVLGAAVWMWGAPATRYLRLTYGPRFTPSWHRITGGAFVVLGVCFVVVSSLPGR